MALLYLLIWSRRIAVCLLLLTAISCSSAQSDEPSSQIKPELLIELNNALPSTAKLDEPGYILQITKQGNTIYEVRSGAADIEQARPITSDTVFHITSLSKQITAAALAHAIEDGLIALDDPVGNWIPQAQKYGDQLTLAHLVYMTSGLTEYTNMPGPDGRPWATFHYFTTDDAIKQA